MTYIADDNELTNKFNEFTGAINWGENVQREGRRSLIAAALCNIVIILPLGTISKKKKRNKQFKN